MKSQLKTQCGVGLKGWEEVVSIVAGQYRMGYVTLVNECPFNLRFGKNPIHPADAVSMDDEDVERLVRVDKTGKFETIRRGWRTREQRRTLGRMPTNGARYVTEHRNPSKVDGREDRDPGTNSGGGKEWRKFGLDHAYGDREQHGGDRYLFAEAGGENEAGEGVDGDGCRR